jgi:Zn-dependent protease with chaperone function
VEQGLKLSRLLAGLHGRAARREVLELIGGVQEAIASHPHLDDRIAALSDAAQVLGSVVLVGSNSRSLQL